MRLNLRVFTFLRSSLDSQEVLPMDKKELFSLIKFIVAAITIVVIVGIISNAGFVMTNLKFEHKDFQIEVSGQEKNTQPR